MSVSGRQQEESEAVLEGISTTPNGVVEIDERRKKLERLRTEGIDPYPHVSLLHERTLIRDVNEAHDADGLDEGGHPELRYTVAGRVISRREHPKTSFIDLRDLSGSLQLVVRLADLGQETYDRVMSLDIG